MEPGTNPDEAATAICETKEPVLADGADCIGPVVPVSGAPNEPSLTASGYKPATASGYRIEIGCAA
ncbi:hypothetical protein SDC9_203761 [bioreactor metagenome]|uniref:Uncharacterized protein n=1 Tax=bioreactor metagenome TaxID=1076179 RepID=A0A645IXB9_9ZZZZ